MGNVDAEDKFFEAVEAFKIADEKARSGGLSNINGRAFRSVIIDLDAAIPGLSDESLGRALLLKGTCFYWVHLGELTKKKSIFFDVDAPPHPLLVEGLACAVEGREILKQRGCVQELPWANDIVSKLGGQ
ncbi:MAG TPA: hypothetical protein VGV87_09535 [Blastocatellia bacterium]|jgi:hypothetical protein|nr:hypothetical protein [Blastocatellia bacterium]